MELKFGMPLRLRRDLSEQKERSFRRTFGYETWYLTGWDDSAYHVSKDVGAYFSESIMGHPSDLFEESGATSPTLSRLADEQMSAFLQEMADITEQHGTKWTPEKLREEAFRLQRHDVVDEFFGRRQRPRLTTEETRAKLVDRGLVGPSGTEQQADPRRK